MELFQQLRHLYVNVGNDVRHLQEMANRSTGTGLSRLQADKVVNEPHSDVKMQAEKVRAKIKEVQDETHFGEVMTCCSEVLKHSLAQLDQLELHLQKYSVQPIGNARQRCESQLNVNENEQPSAACNPVSEAVPVVTEPCQPQAKDWPMTYNIANTPKPSDFGISESLTQRLDEVTAAILKRSQMSHAGVVGQGQVEDKGQAEDEGQGDDDVFNSATNPCLARSTSQSTKGKHTASGQDLKLDVGAIRSHDQNQGCILSMKPVTKLASKTNLNYEPSNVIQSMKALSLIEDENNFSSTLPFPLQGTSFPHTEVRFPKHEVESSSNTRSALTSFDFPIPSPPVLSDMTRMTFNFPTAEKDTLSVLPLSVKKELDSSSTSLLSEQTVNILRQLQLSKISTSGIKLEPCSAKKFGENVPPDHPSTWKSSAVHTGHAAAKRCLDLGGGEKARDTASDPNFSQNAVPKKLTGATDEIPDRSSMKSHPGATMSVLGRGEGTNMKCTTGSGFVSGDWTCPRIQRFTPDDYEDLVPVPVKQIVSLERLNEGIEKANDVLLNKMLDGSSMTLSVEDLERAVGSKASLFLKLMSKTGRLSVKTGERGIAEYSVM